MGQGKSLVAMHNLTGEKLLEADGLGGMPMPSVAVTKKNIPFSNFGEITLEGNRAMVNPAAGKRVFDADIYSPTIPERVWTLQSPAKASDRLLSFFSPLKGPDGMKGNVAGEFYGMRDSLKNGLDALVRGAEGSVYARYLYLRGARGERGFHRAAGEQEKECEAKRIGSIPFLHPRPVRRSTQGRSYRCGAYGGF